MIYIFKVPPSSYQGVDRSTPRGTQPTRLLLQCLVDQGHGGPGGGGSPSSKGHRLCNTCGMQWGALTKVPSCTPVLSPWPLLTCIFFKVMGIGNVQMTVRTDRKRGLPLWLFPRKPSRNNGYRKGHILPVSFLEALTSRICISWDFFLL